MSKRSNRKPDKPPQDGISRSQLEKTIVRQTVALQQAMDRIADLEKKMETQLIGRPSVIMMTAAKIAHEVNRAYCQFIGDHSQVPWDETPDWQKESSLAGVKDILTHPNLSPEESHAMWCRHKKANGWKLGEKKDIEAKTHPCLVPYSDLPPEQRVKDFLFGAAVRSIIGVANG